MNQPNQRSRNAWWWSAMTMMSALLAGVLLACGVYVTPVVAQTDDQLISHVEWITANSPLEYNGEPLPTVEYVSQEMLQIMGYGDEAVAQAEHQGKTLPTVLASYNDYVIYLKTDDTFTDMPWVIVHELVHYLQDVNGTTDDCVPANEPQAYLLHDLWQKENGYEHMRNSGNVFYGLTMAMSCYDRDLMR